MQLHRLTCPYFTVFLIFINFFILEPVIKQALVIFLGAVEPKIRTKSGLCHCSTLTRQTQGDAHLVLTNTISNNRVCYCELNLDYHTLGLG